MEAAYNRYTVTQLRDRLKDLGLSSAGLKKDLVLRMVEHDVSLGVKAPQKQTRAKTASSRRSSSINPSDIATMKASVARESRRRTLAGDAFRTLEIHAESNAQEDLEEEEEEEHDQENSSIAAQRSSDAPLKKSPSTPAVKHQRALSQTSADDEADDGDDEAEAEATAAAEAKSEAEAAAAAESEANDEAGDACALRNAPETPSLSLSASSELPAALAPSAGSLPGLAAQAPCENRAEEEGVVSRAFWRLHGISPGALLRGCGSALVLYIVFCGWVLCQEARPSWAETGLPIGGFLACLVATIALGVYDKWLLGARQSGQVLSEYNRLRLETIEVLIRERIFLCDVIADLEGKFHDLQEQFQEDPSSVELAKSIRETTREIAETINTLANTQALYSSVAQKYNPNIAHVLRDFHSKLAQLN